MIIESKELAHARKLIEKFAASEITREALFYLEDAVYLLDELCDKQNKESLIASNILNSYFSKAKEKIEGLLDTNCLPNEKVLRYWYIVLKHYKGIEAIDQKAFIDLLDRIRPVIVLGKDENYRNLSPKRRWIEVQEIRNGIQAEDFLI